MISTKSFESSSLDTFQMRSKHNDQILFIVAFDKQTMLITIDINGNIYLYRQQQGKYQFQATSKIFSCPILACDIVEQDNYWKLVVVSYDRHIKIIKIIDNSFLMTIPKCGLLHFDEVILSCVWGSEGHEVILGGENGNIYVVDTRSREPYSKFTIGTTPIKLAMGPHHHLYVLSNNTIQKIEISSKTIKMAIMQNLILKTQNVLCDFMISKKHHFNQLVILNKTSLAFHHLENMKQQPQIFPIQNNDGLMRLGWGESFDEIAIYDPKCKNSKGIIFRCTIEGFWYEDE